MDYLWHQVSEEEKQKIKKEAKQIMDSFAKALERVEKKETKSKGLVKRQSQTRKETKTQKSASAFKKLFFENAPQKEGNLVKAEKGGWK